MAATPSRSTEEHLVRYGVLDLVDLSNLLEVGMNLYRAIRLAKEARRLTVNKEVLFNSKLNNKQC